MELGNHIFLFLVIVRSNILSLKVKGIFESIIYLLSYWNLQFKGHNIPSPSTVLLLNPDFWPETLFLLT